MIFTQDALRNLDDFQPSPDTWTALDIAFKRNPDTSRHISQLRDALSAIDTAKTDKNHEILTDAREIFDQHRDEHALRRAEEVLLAKASVKWVAELGQQVLSVSTLVSEVVAYYDSMLATPWWFVIQRGPRYVVEVMKGVYEARWKSVLDVLVCLVVMWWV